MTSFRDDVRNYFEREAFRNPTPAGLRSDVLAHARSRAGERPTPEWITAAVAAAIALAIIAGLLAAGSLRHANTTPGKAGPSPAPRIAASAAYDEAHGNLVIFAGTPDGRVQLDDTWTWDGKGWSQQHPAVKPTARQFAPMAYDSAHRVIVLFGGATWSGAQTKTPSLTPLTDTWTWNGAAWTQRHPQHAPPPPPMSDLASDAMAYDPVSHTVLLYFRGAAGSSETWGWDGTDWTQLHPSTDPRVGQPTLVSDGNGLLLIGMPFERVGGRYFSQTWAWDGRDWKLLNLAVNLPTSTYVAAFDAPRSRVLALDALNLGHDFVDDTWTWNGKTWTRQHPSAGPTGMPYMVYFKALGKIVAWGDRNSAQNGGLWTWDGNNWIVLQPGPEPGPGAKGYLGTMSPAAAEAAIRTMVTATKPVLMPSSLPPGLEAQVDATADNFSVQYRTDQRDKTILWGIVVPNPPPGGPSAVSRKLTFRGVSAEYQIYDSTSPLSSRWLMWIEPGTMAQPETKTPGVPYFLSADGLTDQEFWQLANSLK